MTLYVARNEQRLGPFTLAQAQRMVVTGGLHSDDLAWYEGIPDWIPLDQVPGFLDAKAPPVRPKPQRPWAIYAISAWYGLDIICNLVIGFFALRFEYIHLDTIFWTVALVVDLGLKIAAIIYLWKLKEIAFRILMAVMAITIILNARDLWLWSNAMTTLVTILVYLATIFFTAINVLILYFV